MSKIMFASALIIALNISFGQAQITFQKAYGDSGYDYGTCIKPTIDGGYIVTGIKSAIGTSIYDNCTAEQIYLVKLNSYGVMQWSKSYETFALTGSNSLEISDDGGYIIAGETGTWCPFIGGPSYSHFIFTDSTGNYKWSRNYGFVSSGSPYESSNAIMRTKGGYISVGKRRVDPNSGSFYVNSDVSLMKLDSYGNYMWSMAYGDSTDDVGYSVFPSNDGGYLMGGLINKGMGASQDMYILKVDSVGKMLWNKTFNLNFLDYVSSIIQTKDGNIIVLGNITGTSDIDIVLLKISPNGVLLWYKVFGGGSNDVANCLKQTKDEGFIIAGYTSSFSSSSDAYLVKTDSIGNIQWSKTYGGSGGDYANYVELTNDGGYVVTGSIENVGITNSDIYVLKTDSNGNSNCNENNVQTIQKTYTITSSTKGTYYSTWNSSQNYPISIVNGAIETPICLQVTSDGLPLSNYTIDIYPNPFSTQTTLQTNKPFNNSTLFIINIFGQLVKKISNISGNSIAFDRENLSNGIYFIKILESDRTIYADKLIIVDK